MNKKKTTPVPPSPEKPRTLTSIDLSPESREKLDKMAAAKAMHRKAILERLIDWFVGQDDIAQGSILGTIPESLRIEAAKTWMERQAKGEK